MALVERDAGYRRRRSGSRAGRALLAVVALALAPSGCGPGSCGDGDDDRVAALIEQLEGRCCGYHTEPVEGRIDRDCKAHDMASVGMRLVAGRHQCARWAADCLAEQGEAAAAAVPALIAAVEHGPDNYDTGDGVIGARDAILVALGKTRDPRAVAPLLEALTHPRPLEAGPGAAGYTSSEPADEAAAAEALGWVGPAAATALPTLTALLAEPLTDPRRERRFAAVAGALGRIGDRAAIPALAATLAEPAKAVAAARALAVFGADAAAAGPALIAAVEREPEGYGNSVIRQTVREVLGDEAFRALPPNWDQAVSAMTRWLWRQAKAGGCELGGLEIDGPAEAFRQKIGGGYSFHTRLPRAARARSRRVAGELAIEHAGQVVATQTFGSRQEWEELIADALRSRCPGGDESGG